MHITASHAVPTGLTSINLLVPQMFYLGVFELVRASLYSHSDRRSGGHPARVGGQIETQSLCVFIR